MPPSSVVQSVTSRTRISRRPPPRRRGLPRGWRDRPRGSGAPRPRPALARRRHRSAAAYEGSELGRTASRSRSRLSSLVGARPSRLPLHGTPVPVDPDRPERAGELEHVLLGRPEADLDLRFRSVGQAQAKDRSVVLAPAGAHGRGHVLDLGVEQEPEEIDVMRCQIEESATAVGPRELPGGQVLPWIRERGANAADPSDPACPDDGARASDRRMEPPVESDRGDDSGRSAPRRRPAPRRRGSLPAASRGRGDDPPRRQRSQAPRAGRSAP